MRSLLLTVSLFALALLAGAGCSGGASTDPANPAVSDPGAPTGAVRFELRGINPLMRPPTAMDSGVLSGSTFILVASGDFTKALGARSMDERVVSVIDVRTLCQCIPQGRTNRFIELDESCPLGEQRKCEVEAYCRAGTRGDVGFAITDPLGGVIDRADVHVRDAASVTYDIGGDPKLVSGGGNGASGAAGSKIPRPMKPGPDGFIEILVGDRFRVQGAPIDANGQPLVCGEHCASFRPRADGNLEVENDGSKEWFIATATKPGETDVMVFASGATATVPLRVLAQ